MIARFKINTPDNLLATLTLETTVEEWRKIRKALDKGMDGWYGPERRMVESIDGLLNDVDKVFYAQVANEPDPA